MRRFTEQEDTPERAYCGVLRRACRGEKWRVRRGNDAESRPTSRSDKHGGLGSSSLHGRAGETRLKFVVPGGTPFGSDQRLSLGERIDARRHSASQWLPSIDVSSWEQDSSCGKTVALTSCLLYSTGWQILNGTCV